MNRPPQCQDKGPPRQPGRPELINAERAFP